MAVTRTLVRNLAATIKVPSQILTRINETLLRDNSNGLFVSMVLVYYNVQTGRAFYSNAGHPLPYVIDAAGKIRPFGKATGSLLGVSEDMKFETEAEMLRPNEYLFFHTDGISEARSSGEKIFFGNQRLEELLAQSVNGSSRNLCEKVFNQVSSFQGLELSDDVTLMALKRNG
jgi:sigma-B regulation protein RsbU (phosphoserine phosphatase)